MARGERIECKRVHVPTGANLAGVATHVTNPVAVNTSTELEQRMTLGCEVNLLAIETQSIELKSSLRALLSKMELLRRSEKATALEVHQVVCQAHNNERYVVIAGF